jgi:hypothetical protein
MRLATYRVKIIHTTGFETIEISAESADDALILARNFAILEGLILLRCFIAN